MKVLALDLSLTSTGVAYPLGSVGRWIPPSGVVGMERLQWLRCRLAESWVECGVDLVVIEGYSFGMARPTKGQGGGQPSHAHALGELGGVIRFTLWNNAVPYVDVAPASLKKYATGKGNAKKESVLVEAVKRLGYDGSSTDEADALWLRAMALDAYGEPEVEMPALNRTALEAVPWLELDLVAP